MAFSAHSAAQNRKDINMVSRPKELLDKFFKISLKLRLITADISFLTNCLKAGVFPKFICITSKSSNSCALKAIEFAKRKWLNLEKNQLYSLRSNVEIEKYKLHMMLVKDLSDSEFQNWISWFRKINEIIDHKMIEKYERLNKKLWSLTANLSSTLKQNRGGKTYNKSNGHRGSTNKPEPTTKQTGVGNDLNIVRNISTKELSVNELQLLNKGLNFSLKPLTPPIMDIVADVETTIKKAPDSVKHQIRRNILPILGAKDGTTNRHAVHHKAVKTLKEKEVSITKADKGNAVVVLDKDDYSRRMESLLDDGPFERIQNDPLQRNVKEVKEALQKCNSLIESKDRLKLQTSNPITSRLYGLPKIHKEGNGMRPIVSGIDAPTYKIAKWLVSEFSKFEKPMGCSIKNSIELVEKIKQVKLSERERLVSFDVTALFPSIPVNKALVYLEEWLTANKVSKMEIEEYLLLTKLCMKQNHFQFNGKFYRQTHGTSMGNPLSPFIADLFMSKLETIAKQTSGYFPKHWYRYVDDIFIILDTGKISVENFLGFMNTLEPNIRFTVEEERDCRLPFLDLEITRDNCTLSFDIYRKPTNVDRFIPNDSFCHWSQKVAAFNFLIHRLIRVPLSRKNYNKELTYIKQVAIKNGYSTSLIDQLLRKANWRRSVKESTTLETGKPILRTSLTFYGKKSTSISKAMKSFNTNLQVAYTTNGKLRSLLCNTKDRIPNQQKSGIYKINCQDCEKNYVGQTRRPLNVRYKEHLAHIRFGREEKSSVASHTLQTGHQVGEIKLLKSINNPFKLDAYESLYISRMGKNTLNNDKGPIPSSDLYKLCNKEIATAENIVTNNNEVHAPSCFQNTMTLRSKGIKQAKISKYLTVV